MEQGFAEQNVRAMSEAELARQVGISKAALRKWRREGKGPRFLKLGRIVRYLVHDIEDWLEAHFAEGMRSEPSLTRSNQKRRPDESEEQQ